MRINLIRLGSAATLAAAALVSGCGDGASASGDRTIVAGFYPLAHAAERLAAPGTTVINLTPPASEPHDLELSARDAERVRSADVVLYLGEGFQPALERAVADIHGRAVDLLQGVELLEGDPHVWLDPLRYAAVVERIGALLGREQAAEKLTADLRALHEEFSHGLADCERRTIVTSHAAFAYLAARYDLRQVSVAGLSPEAEPTPRDLERVVEEVRETDATTVFFETLVSPRLARTVARESGARTAVLDPLEGLTPTRLDEGADYFSVMRENLVALREGLGCS